MPRGPIHSSSGGGFGGFSSSGGSSFNSGGGRNSFLIFGGTRLVTTKPISVVYGILTALLVFCLILSFTFFSIISSLKENAKIMEEDAPYFESLQTTGTITQATILSYDTDVELDGVEYYYILYEYNIGGLYYQGYTYTDFTISQVFSFGDSIDIAYAYHEEDLGYYSINLSYNLEDSYQYEYFITSIQEVTISVVVIIILAVASAVGLVLLTVYAKKRNAKQELENKAKNIQTSEICAYCGTTLNEIEQKCPSCGATQKAHKIINKNITLE